MRVACVCRPFPLHPALRFQCAVKSTVPFAFTQTPSELLGRPGASEDSGSRLSAVPCRSRVREKQSESACVQAGGGFPGLLSRVCLCAHVSSLMDI